jgi:hypothetical protein
MASCSATGNDFGAIKCSVMANRAHVVTNKEQADPYSGSSLVPMLVIGLVLTFAGMIAAVLLS